MTNRAVAAVLIGMALWLGGEAVLAAWEEHIDAGESAYKHGERAAAEKAFDQALAEAEKFGESDPRLAVTLNDLGVIYDETGRYDKAEAVYKRALAIRQKVYGPDNVEVATSLNNLANLYKDRGRFKDAEPLYNSAIAIYAKSGKNDELLAMGYHNLAVLYNKQGRLKDALPLYEKSLALAEKSLGPENEHVVDLVSAVALIYQKQGRAAEARPLFRRYLKNVASVLKLDLDDREAVPRLKKFAEEMRRGGEVGNADLIDTAVRVVYSPQPKSAGRAKTAKMAGRKRPTGSAGRAQAARKVDKAK